MQRWAGMDSASALAEQMLGSATDRFRHVAGVASTASLAARAVPTVDAELLVAAAWLHDIGYAPQIASTGFHPLDGARYLRGIGAPERLCRLVANHTASSVEARSRGLLTDLTQEFPAEQSSVADALTFADMTTGPSGEPISVTERLTEILVRYPPGHVVHHAIQEAQPQILATVRRVDTLLAAGQPR